MDGLVSGGGGCGRVSPSRFYDRNGLELFGPGRMSADRLVRRVVGERVPQRWPDRSGWRFIRLYGHRYPGDGQHVLLAVRTHERFNRSAAGYDAIAGHRLGRGHRSDAAGDATTAIVYLAPFLHDGVKVAGRVRSALAAQWMVSTAGRQWWRQRTATGVRSRSQIYSLKKKNTVRTVNMIIWHYTLNKH